MRARQKDQAGTAGAASQVRCAAGIGTLVGTLALLSLSGCATPPKDPGALTEYRANDDPLEPTNRFFYRVDNTVDHYTLRPVAQAYVAVLPAPVRTGVHNVISNFASPTRLANDVLEAKPRRAGTSFMRFLINSTVGLGGVFDVARGWGYPGHENDGGMTLAVWGVPSGPFLYLPAVGPSSPRDASGFGLDIALSPLTYVPRGYGLLTLNYSLYGVGIVDARARVLGELSQIKNNYLDPYAALRSLYRQHREAEIQAVRDDNQATTPDWYTH